MLLNGKEFKNIKNIIFDLGGVIIDVDYHITINSFKKLGFQNFDEIYGQFKQSILFDQYEKGLIDSNAFRNKVLELGKINLSVAEFDAAWNSMILEMPSNNLLLLKELKKHFNTYLYSNTNEIHLEYFFNYLEKNFEVHQFDEYFHKTYMSCRINMRKPDTNGFQLILDENNLNPEETLFIDDTHINVDGAIKTGIQGYYLNRGEQITEIFSQFRN